MVPARVAMLWSFSPHRLSIRPNRRLSRRNRRLTSTSIYKYRHIRRPIKVHPYPQRHVTFLLFQARPHNPFTTSRRIRLLTLRPLTLHLINRRQRQQLTMLTSITMQILTLLLRRLLLRTLRPIIKSLRTLTGVPHLTLRLNRMLRRLINNKLISVTIIINSGFSRLLRQIRLHTHRNNTFQRNYQRPPPRTTFKIAESGATTASYEFRTELFTSGENLPGQQIAAATKY